MEKNANTCEADFHLHTTFQRLISLIKKVAKLIKEDNLNIMEKLFINDVVGNGWIINYFVSL